MVNAREKKDLIDFLDADNTDHPEYTNWKYAILEFNKGKGLTYEQTKNNLLEKGILTYPNCLPFDLERPNYLELPANERENKRKKEELERKQANEREVANQSSKKKRKGSKI